MPCAHSGAGARAVTSKRTEQASKEARGNSTSAGRASRRLAQLRGQSLSRRRQEEPASRLPARGGIFLVGAGRARPAALLPGVCNGTFICLSTHRGHRRSTDMEGAGSEVLGGGSQAPRPTNSKAGHPRICIFTSCPRAAMLGLAGYGQGLSKAPYGVHRHSVPAPQDTVLQGEGLRHREGEERTHGHAAGDSPGSSPGHRFLPLIQSWDPGRRCSQSLHAARSAGRGSAGGLGQHRAGV